MDGADAAALGRGKLLGGAAIMVVARQQLAVRQVQPFKAFMQGGQLGLLEVVLAWQLVLAGAADGIADGDQVLGLLGAPAEVFVAAIARHAAQPAQDFDVRWPPLGVLGVIEVDFLGDVIDLIAAHTHAGDMGADQPLGLAQDAVEIVLMAGGSAHHPAMHCSGSALTSRLAGGPSVCHSPDGPATSHADASRGDRAWAVRFITSASVERMTRCPIVSCPRSPAAAARPAGCPSRPLAEPSVQEPPMRPTSRLHRPSAPSSSTTRLAAGRRPPSGAQSAGRRWPKPM